MQTEKLLKLLKENKVKFIVIGASAFPAYGFSRTTLDIDIFIKPERNNAQRTLKALEDFGYDVSSVSIKDLLSRKILIRQYMLETDIHPFVTGVTFDAVWKGKITGEYGDVEVYFPSLKDIIKMKKAAGRPKDKEDLKYLTKIAGNKNAKSKS